MGFISKLATSGKDIPFRSPTDRGPGRNLWREIFTTSKEDGFVSDPRVVSKPKPTDGFVRSLSTQASFERLLQAFRSRAPGGPSDDRMEASRHFEGFVYVAIHRISSQLAQAQFQVFQRDPHHPDGKRPVTEMDPPQGDRLCRPYDLVRLLEKPNTSDYFGKLMYQWSMQKRLTGSALTWLVPNQFGVPYEMYPIPTALAIPQPAINPDYPDGFYRIQPLYPYGPFSSYPTPASAVGAAIPARWMLAFRYPHPFLRYDGYSPLTGLRRHIDQLEAMDRSRWYTMKRSINPSGVLNFADMEGGIPLPEEEIARIHAEWEANFQGPENHGRLIVGAPGSNLEEWGRAPAEMDYPAGWDQVSSFVLGGGFGITRPAAGMVEDGSYSTLFATLKQLHLITLQPDCDDFAAELTRHLAPYFGDNLIIEIRCPRIDDHDVKNARLGLLMAAKCITKNEMRKELEMELTTEPWGAEIAGEPPLPSPEMLMMMQGAPPGPGAGPPGPAGPPPDELQSPEMAGPEIGGPTGEDPTALVPPVLMQGRTQAGIYPGVISEEDFMPEPPVIAASRPQAGRLARFAQGPRKNLNQPKRSFYEKVTKALENGNKNGHSNGNGHG